MVEPILSDRYEQIANWTVQLSCIHLVYILAHCYSSHSPTTYRLHLASFPVFEPPLPPLVLCRSLGPSPDSADEASDPLCSFGLLTSGFAGLTSSGF